MYCGLVRCKVVSCSVVCCGVLRPVVVCGLLWCVVLCGVGGTVCGHMTCPVVCCVVMWCGRLSCGVVWCHVVWCGVVWWGSNRLSFAGQKNAATKASTGRTGIAFHMQTKLPTSISPDCLGATLCASVRTEKTKSPGGWAGLFAHVKMENRLHSAKGATCSS